MEIVSELLGHSKMSITQEHYLKTEKLFMPNSVYKTIQRLRRAVRVAVGAEYLAVCRQTNLNFLGQNLREYSHKFN